MKRHEAPETLFCKMDVPFSQKVLNEPLHPFGSAGRPQRSPIGLFKAHIVKRLKHIPSELFLFPNAALSPFCEITMNSAWTGLIGKRVGRTGLEPATFCTSSRCPTELDYRPTNSFILLSFPVYSRFVFLRNGHTQNPVSTNLLSSFGAPVF